MMIFVEFSARSWQGARFSHALFPIAGKVQIPVLPVLPCAFVPAAYAVDKGKLPQIVHCPGYPAAADPCPLADPGKRWERLLLLGGHALTDVAVHHKIRGFDSGCKRSAVDGKPAFVIHDHVFHKITVGPVAQHPIPVVLFYKLAAFQFPDGLVDHFFIHITVFSNHSRFDHSVLKAVRPGEQIRIDKHSLGGQGNSRRFDCSFSQKTYGSLPFR